MLCPGLNVYAVTRTYIMNRYKEKTNKNNTKTIDKKKIKRKMIFF